MPESKESIHPSEEMDGENITDESPEEESVREQSLEMATDDNEKKGGKEEDKKEKSGENENPTEQKLDKVDEAFDDLLSDALEAAKNSPEEKKKAIELCIHQFRQIAEEIKQVRDMKNLQEFKKLMMEQWKELNELAGGNPELLASIQEWGDKFIDEKVLYYEIIGDFKDELFGESQETEELWAGVLTDLNVVARELGESDLSKLKKFLSRENFEFDEDITTDLRTGIDIFLEKINDPESFYTSGDLEVKEISIFLSRLVRFVSNLDNHRASELKLQKRLRQQWERDEDYAQKNPKQYKEILEDYDEKIANNERLGKIVEGLIEKKNQLSQKIKDISSKFKFVKKTRDTHFLKVYNKQPKKAAA